MSRAPRDPEIEKLVRAAGAAGIGFFGGGVSLTLFIPASVPADIIADLVRVVAPRQQRIIDFLCDKIDGKTHDK